MASKQANAKPTAPHNGGKPYQHYNTDTNQFETRQAVVTRVPSNNSTNANTGNGGVKRQAVPRDDGGLNDYIDRMLQTGMPQRPADLGNPQTARKPVTGFPTAMPSDLRGPQGGNGERELEEALNSGLSWEHIAAGAAGAAAALIAQRTLSNMNQKNNAAGDPFGNGGAGNKPSGVGQPPKTNTRQSVPVNQQHDILTRNGLVQGQPTNNPDIDAQFYEIFGLPPPTRAGMEPRLVPGNSVKGPANARETYVPPLANNTAIPGPSQRTKQLGDADSPTYRENFGYNDLARRAQEIVDRMETYGDYNIDRFMDPSAEPAVAARVGALLRGMM